MREEVLTFPSDGHRLVGILTRPEADAPPPRAVLLVHGWGGYRIGTHGMLVALARALAAAGLPALRFDLRGRGDSDGHADRVGLDDMISDTLAAAEALSQATGAPRLGAVGHCSGGNVILGAAVQDARIDRLVPISTFPFQEQMTEAHRAAFRRDRRRTVLARALDPRTWGKVLCGQVRWGRVLAGVIGRESAPADAAGRNLKQSRRDIPGMLASFKGRALFLYGGADPVDQASRRFYETFADRHGLDFTFAAIEGANHNFYSTVWEAELARLARAFLCA